MGVWAAVEEQPASRVMVGRERSGEYRQPDVARREGETPEPPMAGLVGVAPVVSPGLVFLHGSVQCGLPRSPNGWRRGRFGKYGWHFSGTNICCCAMLSRRCSKSKQGFRRQ